MAVPSSMGLASRSSCCRSTHGSSMDQMFSMRDLCRKQPGRHHLDRAYSQSYSNHWLGCSSKQPAAILLLL